MAPIKRTAKLCPSTKNMGISSKSEVIKRSSRTSTKALKTASQTISLPKSITKESLLLKNPNTPSRKTNTLAKIPEENNIAPKILLHIDRGQKDRTPIKRVNGFKNSSPIEEEKEALQNEIKEYIEMYGTSSVVRKNSAKKRAKNLSPMISYEDYVAEFGTVLGEIRSHKKENTTINVPSSAKRYNLNIPKNFPSSSKISNTKLNNQNENPSIMKSSSIPKPNVNANIKNTGLMKKRISRRLKFDVSSPKIITKALWDVTSDTENASSECDEFLKNEKRCGICRSTSDKLKILERKLNKLDTEMKKIREEKLSKLDVEMGKIRAEIAELKAQDNNDNTGRKSLNGNNLRVKALTNATNKACVKGTPRSNRKMDKAIELYNSTRKDLCLETPRTDRKLLQTPKTQNSKTLLSIRLQRQCLSLLE